MTEARAGRAPAGLAPVPDAAARWMYKSLYQMHQVALHGWWKAALATVGRMIARQTEPHVKLH